MYLLGICTLKASLRSRAQIEVRTSIKEMLLGGFRPRMGNLSYFLPRVIRIFIASSKDLIIKEIG